MKKMKKFLSILLASAMTLAMAAPGFAAEGTGSITITNATNNQTYYAYRLFGANPSGDGNGQNAKIAYTATADQVEKLMGDGYNAEAATLSNDYLTFTKTSGSADYNVEKKSGKTDEEFIQYLNGFFEPEEGKDEFAKTTWTVKDEYKAVLGTAIPGTFDNGKVRFTGLDYGYYFVTSSLGTALTITSTNRDAVVIDKNQGPHWDDEKPGDGGKKIVQVNNTDVRVNGEGVGEISANYGDIIHFEVKFQATDYAGTKKISEYYLQDVLAPGMSYQKDSDGKTMVSVTVEGGKKELEAGDYTVIMPEDNTKNEFELQIPWVNDDTDKSFKYPYTDSVQTVTITYSAKVEDTALVAQGGNINTANFTYQTLKDDNTPDPKEPYKEENEKTATTYTFALAVNKTNKIGEALEGATFELTDIDGNLIKVKPVYQLDADGNPVTDAEGKPVQEPGVYAYDATAASNVVVSPKEGIITIKGIAEGNYLLTETAAPDGYNLLPTPQPVSASMDSKTETTVTTTVYYDADGNPTTTEISGAPSRVVTTPVPVSLINVVNFAGTILPGTGGIGTTIFYAAGIILMAGAVFFVVRRKRA